MRSWQNRKIFYPRDAERQRYKGTVLLLTQRKRNPSIQIKVFLRDMRKIVNNYMSVVLNEQPLDPTIVEFDDSEAY